MHKPRAILLLFFCGLALAARAAEQEAWILESPEGVDYDTRTSIATATNGIRVKYAGSILSAHQATVNQNSGDVVAEGDVRLEREGQLWIGESIHFNFKTRKVVGENFRSGQAPFFIKGDAFAGDQNAGVYVAGTAVVTTDDYADPGYRVRAQTITVVTGEYIEARHAVLYLGNVPVFYFPYYRRSLKHTSNDWTLLPGYRSKFGPYLLTSYNWYWNDKLDGAVHLDARESRGLGVGPDVNYHLPRFGDGTVKTYYTHDNDPGLDPNGVPIAPDRWRIYLTQQGNVTSNLTIKARVAYQSDAYVIRDFFEREYRKNQQPSTFVEVNQNWSNFSLNLLAQPQVNNFWETVERLPDIKLTGQRQQIGSTPFFYESDSSVGYFEREFATGSTNLPYDAFRADTFHQVLLPWTFFDWLNITPRVGGRFTYYGEAGGPGATTEEQDRGVFNTGAEASFKASRVWPGTTSRFWEIDGIRHIIQPSINYAYVPRPSRAPQQLPQFDYEIQSTRLLPITFPDYNAIDSIDSENVLRLSLRNKLQTKRKDNVDNLVNWALYTDWRLTPTAGQSTFSDIYSDTDLKPFHWLVINSELRYNVGDKFWDEINHTATLTPNDTWNLSIGQRYLRNFPGQGPSSGNNTIFGTFFCKFNENWGARIYERFEARDGTLEEQFYTIYRDFRSWTAALTLRISDDRTGPRNYTVAFAVSLKAFPRYHLGADATQQSLLIGN